MSRCAWCGVAIDEGEGFRATEPAEDRGAAFCRLEHIVAWAIRGPRWEPGSPLDHDDHEAAGLGRCAHCAASVRDSFLLLVRHRGVHRIGDAFCDSDHLLAWAKAGGRWRTAS